MTMMVGTGKDDLISTSDGGDEAWGKGGKDDLSGGAGNDTLMAGGGDDVAVGGSGDDVIYGSNPATAFSDRRIVEDYKANVVFQGESAGYKNALGAYTFDAEGNITGVKVLFANASLTDSGGSLVSGVSSNDIPLAKGERVGFFVVPDAFARSTTNQDLLQKTDGTFKLSDLNGNSNVLSANGGLTLSWIAADGTVHQITSAYGNQVFHSLANLNQDGLDHVKTSIDPATGLVRVGFEDLLNGGDKDFDDSVFTIDIGVKNAEVWSGLAKQDSDNDRLMGGDGRDAMWGMRGNDTMDGGNDADKLSGNSGDDQMMGGDGDDVIGGGKDNDSLWGDAGNDTMDGNSGNDMLRDGAGEDVVNGGTGNDTVYAGAGGKDFYNGGKGADTIDFGEMGGKSGIKLNLSKSTVSSGGVTDTVKGFETAYGTDLADNMTGSKRAESLYGEAGDDVLRGKLGSDVLTGGAGADVFEYQRGDWARGSLDRIADFVKGTDVLDLNEIMSGSNAGTLDGVRLVDGDDGTTVKVVIDGTFRQIALLEDVHNLTVADLSNAGSLIL